MSPGGTTREVVYGAKRGPGETRELVKKHWLKGHSVRDIARLADVSEVAVRKHLQRLREAGEIEEASA